MTEKLNGAELRFREIEAALSDGEVVSDIERYTKLMKEYRALLPLIEKFREYKKTENDIAGAKALLDEGDPEMREMAQEELRCGKERLAVLEEELKLLLLPRDPNDDKNVIVEIRAGAGGDEAALFAGVLYRMYTMFADSEGFKTELISSNETGLGGFREISFMVIGDGAYSRFKYESGVHRVQRVPETETSGRIHTSTATVAVLPEAEDVEIELNPADLEIETIKSSGARRTACKQDRIRDPYDTQAHGDRGGVSGRKKPIQEPRQSAEDHEVKAVRHEASGGKRENRRRSAQSGRHGRPK